MYTVRLALKGFTKIKQKPPQQNSSSNTDRQLKMGLSGCRRGVKQTCVQTNRNKQRDGAAHFVRGVLGVWLALGCPAGHGAGPDVAEVDLALRGRAASRLAPNNDGAARQDLRRTWGGGINSFQNRLSAEQMSQPTGHKPESHMDGKKKWPSALGFFPHTASASQMVMKPASDASQTSS